MDVTSSDKYKNISFSDFPGNTTGRIRIIGSSADLAQHAVICTKIMSNIIKLLVGSILLLSASIAFSQGDEDVYTIEKLREEGWSISGPISPLEAEKKSMKRIVEARKSDSKIPLAPFGYGQSKWERFKARLKEGESLVFISAPRSRWDNLRGTEGYAIIRNGKLEHYFETLVN